MQRCAPIPVRRILGYAIVAIMLASSTPAEAGMPAVVTEEVRLVLRLDGTVRERIQAVSFFVAGILLSAFLVRGLWNFLALDFPRLPRLSYAKATALVLLWGLLFVVVLTMISGARELMTPGAWKSGTIRLMHIISRPSSRTYVIPNCPHGHCETGRDTD